MHSINGNGSKRKRSDEELNGDDATSDTGSVSAGFDTAGNPSNGSFLMDDIKASSDYDRRITLTNAPKKRYALALAYLGTNYQGIFICCALNIG